VRARNLTPRTVGDMEEILADPAIEAVIVAGKLSGRAQLLRRALQSERHVLCVHPPDPSPDVAYEAALLQADTHCVLLPLLPDAMHPAEVRLREWLRSRPTAPAFRCLQLERCLAGPLFVEPWRRRAQPSFPDWSILRALGGEIVEISAFTSTDEVIAEEPLLLSGRFESGGLIQASLLPNQRQPRWRLQVLATVGGAELIFPAGSQGPARFEVREPDAAPHVEEWPAWDPWPEMVRVFETAVEASPRRADTRVKWQDCVRALELDDAARRSVERRRATTLDFQEVSESVGFKGTMTLVGCAMLWGLLLLLFVGNWYRPALWAIPVLLGTFLALQFLRWFAAAAPEPTAPADEDAAPPHEHSSNDR
jgi:predicted dehydrogenase